MQSDVGNIAAAHTYLRDNKDVAKELLKQVKVKLSEN